MRWIDIESDRNRMTAADLATPAHHASPRAVRADDEAGRNLLAIGNCQGLALWADGNVRDLALQEGDAARDQATQPVHQARFFVAFFEDGFYLGELAKPRHPDVFIAQRRRQHLVEY